MDTATLEADTRILIDKSLENLGWVLGGRYQNVYFERPKTSKEQQLLGGERPDYVLYSKDERGEDKAIMIIEAKRRGARVDTALEQGIRYAKKLDAPMVFATDGLFCKSYHAKFDRTPILNGEEVDEFLRECLAKKYFSSWEVNTVSPKVQYDRGELIKIFDEANNMLRGLGLRAGIERFGEFANILFLKLISENAQTSDSHIKTAFVDSCHWDTIKKIPKSGRIMYVNQVFEQLDKLYGTDIFTPLIIRSDDVLGEIMDKLDPLTLTNVDSDVKGDAFEYFLKKSAATKNDLGEYFTPRHIVKTMVKLVNPQVGEKIYDPFCGTGGFLIESFRHIWNTMPRNSTTLSMLKQSTIYGNEITNTARITKMNMILAGDGHSNIHMRDSLASPVDGSSGEGYDIVITNMPYSQKSKHGNLYDLPSNNGDSICVQHCMKAINRTAENGRMALVVPEGFLFRKDLSKTRELLLQSCNLQSIISLPQGVFLPYTSVKTDIIYATNVNKKASKKRKDFWYFEVKSDGYTIDNHRRKLEGHSDLDIWKEYRKLDDDQHMNMLDVGFEVVPLDKVKDNSYVLVGNRYRVAQRETYEYEAKKLSEIAGFIRGIKFPKAAQKIGIHPNCLGVVTTKAARATKIEDCGIISVDISYARDEKYLRDGDILISLANSLNLVGRTTYVDKQHEGLSFGSFMGVIRPDQRKVLPRMLYYSLNSDKAKQYFLAKAKTTTNISNLTFEDLREFTLSLPPLQIQQQIVAELDSYQRIVNGATAVVESYVPFVNTFNVRDMKKIGDLCDLATGSTPSTRDRENYDGGTIKWLVSGDIHKGIIFDCNGRITEKGLRAANLKVHRENSVLIALNGQGKTRGTVALLKTAATSNQSLIAMFPKTDCIIPDFLYYVLKGMYKEIRGITGNSHRSGLNMQIVRDICVPIPDVDTQKKILAQIEAEQTLIDDAKQLVLLFTKKMQDRINS